MLNTQGPQLEQGLIKWLQLTLKFANEILRSHCKDTFLFLSGQLDSYPSLEFLPHPSIISLCSIHGMDKETD